MTLFETKKQKLFKRYIIKGNFHLHTYFSDGLYSPKSILKYARDHNIKALSVTDHNIIKGAQQAAKLAQKYDLFFLPGIECTFSVGGRYFELLAYFKEIEDLEHFYSDFLNNGNFIPEYSSIKNLIEQIEYYNGVAIAPHPFGRKGIFRHRRKMGENSYQVNGYEKINAFTGRMRNKRAEKYLDKNKDCLVFGAADMHFFKAAMDICYTELSSSRPITKEELWQNFKLNKKTIDFKPVGKCLPPHVIWFQKILCGVRLDLLRYYFLYLFRKRQCPRIAKQEGN